LIYHAVSAMLPEPRRGEAISRTLVEGTWLKMLWYQCTIGFVEKKFRQLIPYFSATRDRREWGMLGRKERDRLSHRRLARCDS
jgi:hypothetical protein